MKEVLLISNIDLQSKDILKYASAFCEAYQLRLHILHFDSQLDPILISSPRTYQTMSHDIYNYERKNELIQKIEEAVAPDMDHDWLSITVNGADVSYNLQRFIKNREIDLILLGQSLFTKHFDEIGDDIKKVLTRELKTPMLVIPPFYAFEPFNRTNYLLKFLNEDNVENIRKVAQWYPDTSIDITQIQEESRQNHTMKEFDNWIKYLKSEIDSTIRPVIEEGTLSDFIKRENNSIVER